MHWPLMTPVRSVQQPFECVESCKCNLQSEGSTGNGLISELPAPHHQVVTTCHYPKHQLTRTRKLTRAFWHLGRTRDGLKLAPIPGNTLIDPSHLLLAVVTVDLARPVHFPCCTAVLWLAR